MIDDSYPLNTDLNSPGSPPPTEPPTPLVPPGQSIPATNFSQPENIPTPPQHPPLDQQPMAYPPLPPTMPNTFPPLPSTPPLPQYLNQTPHVQPQLIPSNPMPAINQTTPGFAQSVPQNNPADTTIPSQNPYYPPTPQVQPTHFQSDASDSSEKVSTKSLIGYFVLGLLLNVFGFIVGSIWILSKIKENKRPRFISLVSGLGAAVVLMVMANVVFSPLLESFLVKKYPEMGYIPQSLKKDYPDAKFGVHVNFHTSNSITTSELTVSTITKDGISEEVMKAIGSKVCSVLNDNDKQYDVIQVESQKVTRFLIFHSTQSQGMGATCDEWLGLTSSNIGSQPGTTNYILPSGYIVATENEKVASGENKYYYETRFVKDKDEAARVVVMKTEVANYCMEPTPNSLVRNYTEISINGNAGCQMSWLDEKTNEEKARLIRWNTTANGYTVMSYDMNLSFQDTLSIAEQFK
jgi:hypothetical protein